MHTDYLLDNIRLLQWLYTCQAFKPLQSMHILYESFTVYSNLSKLHLDWSKT